MLLLFSGKGYIGRPSVPSPAISSEDYIDFPSLSFSLSVLMPLHNETTWNSFSAFYLCFAGVISIADLLPLLVFLLSCVPLLPRVTTPNETLFSLAHSIYLFIYTVNTRSFIFPHNCLRKIREPVLLWGEGVERFIWFEHVCLFIFSPDRISILMGDKVSGSVHHCEVKSYGRSLIQCFGLWMSQIPCMGKRRVGPLGS